MAVSYQIFPAGCVGKRDPGASLEIDGIDARDGAPVIDAGSYAGRNEAITPIRVSAWERVGSPSC